MVIPSHFRRILPCQNFRGFALGVGLGPRGIRCFFQFLFRSVKLVVFAYVVWSLRLVLWIAFMAIIIDKCGFIRITTLLVSMFFDFSCVVHLTELALLRLVLFSLLRSNYFHYFVEFSPPPSSSLLGCSQTRPLLPKIIEAPIGNWWK